MPTVYLLYFDAASGHRSGAEALRRALDQHPQRGAFDVVLLDLVEYLGTQPVLQQVARLGIGLMNRSSKHEIGLSVRPQVRLFQAVQRHLPARLKRATRRFWDTHPPGLLLSLTPIINALVWRALRATHPQCPYWVLPVDYAECLPRYWFDADTDIRYLLPTQRLHAQALASGVSSTRLTPIAGMPIDPAFYTRLVADRAAELASLGLSPGVPTILMHFGGQGSVFLRRCALQLRELGAACNLICLCGRDAGLYAAMQRLDTPYAKLVLAYQPAPPARYYQLADVVVGKPGAMTLTESLVSGKPLVAIESQSLALVQRANEAWIVEQGVGAVTRVPQLAATLRRVVADEGIAQRVAVWQHRSVFEVAAQVVTHLLAMPTQP